MITITKVGSLVKYDGVEGNDNLYESVNEPVSINFDGSLLTYRHGDISITGKALSLFSIAGSTPTNASELSTQLALVFPSAGGAASTTLEVVTIELNNDEIKALPGTDIDILSTPGANKIYLPQIAYIYRDFVTGYGGIDAAADYPALWIGNKFNNIQLVEFIDEPDTPRSDLTLLLANTNKTIFRLVTYDEIRQYGSTISWEQKPRAINPTDDGVNTSLKIGADNSINFTGGHADNRLIIRVIYDTMDLT